MTGITYLSPCPWTPLHNLASHLWVLISGLLSLMKRAIPKLSLTGPKGPPRHSAAGMAEGRLFCPKLSYFGLTQSKVRPYSRPHPLNAYPINVIEPHGLEDARPVSRESERVKLTCFSRHLFPQITTASSSHPDSTEQHHHVHNDDLRTEQGRGRGGSSRRGPSSKQLRGRNFTKKGNPRFWVSGPVVKMPHFQSRGYRFNPWSGN